MTSYDALLVATSDFALTSTSTFFCISGEIVNRTTENWSQLTARAAGTLKNLFVRVTTNSRSATSTFRTRKNTANGAMSVTFAASTTGTAEDTSNTDTIAAGDLINYQLSTSGTGSILASIVSTTFLASTDTATILASGGNGSQITASQTRYYGLQGALSSNTNSTEANAKCRIRAAATVRYLIAVSRSNANNGTTVRIRVNGANGNSSASFGSSSTGIVEDTVNTETVVAGDDVDISMVSGSSGAITINVIGCTIINTNQQGYLFGSDPANVIGTIAANITRYIPIGGKPFRFTTEVDSQMKVRVDSPKFKELTVLVTANTINGSTTFKTRINGADGNQSVSFAASTTGIASDSTNNDQPASTDNINYSVVSGGSTGTMTMTVISMIEEHITSILYNRSISEGAISVSETLARKVLRPISATSVTISQTLSRKVIRPVSDASISISQTLARKVIRAISNSISVSDSLSRIKYTNRSMSETAVTISQTLGRKVIRPISETSVLISQTLARKVIRPISETSISISQTLSRKVIRPINDNSISVTDGGIQKSTTKIITDSAINISQTLLRKVIRPISDSPSITVSDSISLLITRPFNQIVSVSDSVVKKVYYYITESGLNISDSLSSARIKPRSISENSVSVSDSITGREYLSNRTLNDGVIVGQTSVVKKVIHSITTTEAAITISETLTKKVIHQIVESLTSVSDSLSRKKTANRSISNDSTDIVSDLLDRVTIKSRTVTEAAGISTSDSISIIKRFVRPITDSTDIVDVISRQIDAQRTIPEDMIKVTDAVMVSKFSINDKRKFKTGRRFVDRRTNDSRIDYGDIKEEFSDNKETY